jgi:hypothetical protein
MPNVFDKYQSGYTPVGNNNPATSGSGGSVNVFTQYQNTSPAPAQPVQIQQPIPQTFGQKVSGFLGGAKERFKTGFEEGGIGAGIINIFVPENKQQPKEVREANLKTLMEKPLQDSTPVERIARNLGSGAIRSVQPVLEFMAYAEDVNKQSFEKVASAKGQPKWWKDFLSNRADTLSGRSEAISLGASKVKNVENKVAVENPTQIDSFIEAVGSTLAFMTAGVLSGGSAVLPAMLETFGEMGQVAVNTKGKPEDTRLNRVIINGVANGIYNYFTDKWGLFSKEKIGLKKMITGFLSEGSQEANQQFWSNVTSSDSWPELWKKMVQNKQEGKYLFEDTKPMLTEMTKGMPESFVMGGVIGGMFSLADLSTQEVTGGEGAPTPNIFDKYQPVPEEMPTGGAPLEETPAGRALSALGVEATPENVALEEVRKYINQTLPISESSIKTLQGLNIQDNVKYDVNGNTKLYRIGEVTPGEVNSFSIKPMENLGEQSAYTIAKDEVLIDTTAETLKEKIREVYKENADEFIRTLQEWNTREAEVMAIPQDIRESYNKENFSEATYNIAKENGGITISLEGDRPSKGFVYSPDKNTETKIPVENFSPADIDAFVDKHIEALSQAGNHLGIWEDNGIMYLDVSRVEENLDTALKGADASDQLAVFDLEKFETVYTEKGKVENEKANNTNNNKGEVPGTNKEGSEGSPPEVQGVVQEENPAEVISKSTEDIKRIYKAKEEKVYEALGRIFTELDVAEAGQRVFLENGEVMGIKSTFPDWVPEHLRSKKLFDSVLKGIVSIEDLKYPGGNRTAQRALYDEILDRVDRAVGVDTSKARNAILDAYAKPKATKETTNKTARPTSESTPRSEKPVEQKVTPRESQEPVGQGRAKPSRFQERIQETLLEDDPARYALDQEKGTYNVLNLEEDAQRAVDYLESNPEESVAVSLGLIEPPRGQTRNAIAIATALKAKEEQNYTLFADVINSTSLKSTRMGQEIVTLRGKFSDDSAENYVKRAIDTRMKNLAERLVSKAERMGRKFSYKEEVTQRVDEEVVKVKKKLQKEQSKIKMAQDIIDALRC